MMRFRTEIDIPKADFEIGAAERMLFVGSCFADNLGRRFVENRFRATVNPFGVMYNPASILHTVEKCSEGRPRVAVFTLGTNHVYILNKSADTSEPACVKRKILSTKRSTSLPPLSRKYSAIVSPARATLIRAPGGSFICPNTMVVLSITPDSFIS